MSKSGPSNQGASHHDRNNQPSTETGLGYGPDKIASIFGDILQVLENRLLGPDGSPEITISSHEIRNALLPFKSWQDQELQSILFNGWDDISKASEEAYWAKMRTHPLERLMVRNIAHLLAPYGEPATQDISFSRQIIPAFSALLLQMVGPELMKEYRKRAQDLVDQHKEANSDIVDWHKINGTASAHAIINDILIYISQYFQNMEQRRLWMIDFFNQNMDRDSAGAEKDWKFDDLSFIQLITALYHDLGEHLQIDYKKEALLKRYGPANLENLELLIHGLQEDTGLVFAEGLNSTPDPDI